MIKNIKAFLFESSYSEAIKGAGTIGKWVEDKVHNNIYQKELIAPFLIDIDPTIRIANAIDMLSEFDKKQIFYKISNSKKDESVTEAQGGKWIFKSFLKVISSLNLSNLLRSANKDYIIYYETVDIHDDLMIGAFQRFKSLIEIYSNILNQDCKAFYGVDSNLNFVYGLTTKTNRILIGSFKLTKSSFQYLKQLSSMSIANLKRDIIEYDWEDMLLLRKIFKFMLEYPLGDKNKFEPMFDNGVMTFSYYGVSKWDNGVIDDGEYINIKNNLKTRLSTESWSNRILISITADNFYLKIHFKLK